MDLSKFRVNTKSVEEGVVVDCGEGLKIRVARSGNAKHTKELQRITKPHLRSYQNKTISDELVLEHSLQAFVGTVLLGWEGLTIDGADVPYSREKAIEVLRDPQYKDFRDMVESLASEAEVFRNEEIADTVKN